MPEQILMLKLALFSLSKLTPFAWLAVLGSLLAVVGAATVYLAGEALGLEQRFGHDIDESKGDFTDFIPSQGQIRPDESSFQVWLATISFFENGYYVFLAGVVLLIIGLYPFVFAAPR